MPPADPRYRELRTRLAVAPETTLPLPRVPEFGWNPALEGLRRLYDQGKVAVLPSVDFADADQSHVNSVAYWRRGIVGPSFETTGWLGRTLDAVGASDNPLQGISASWSPDPVLTSGRAPTATVYDPNGFSFHIEGVWRGEGFTRAYRDAARGSTGSDALAAARRTYENAFLVQERLAPLKVDETNLLPPTPVEDPDSEVGTGLRNLARMLAAGFGTRVAALSIGGFDTHDDQDTEHPELLKDLADSLWAWQADLTARGLSSRVLTLVWSEFGRRPEDNDRVPHGLRVAAGGLARRGGGARPARHRRRPAAPRALSRPRRGW